MISYRTILLTSATILAFSPLSAQAGQSEKRLALEAVKQFATSIACNTTFDRDSESFVTKVKDVYSIDVSDTNPAYGEGGEYDMGGRDYLVHWGGDEGCYGGSGTYSHYITHVSRFDDSKPFIISTDNYHILDNIDEGYKEINSRFIESVSVKNNVIDIVSYEFGDDDCNNCASLKYKYKLDYDSNSGWYLFDDKYLGKRAKRTDYS